MAHNISSLNMTCNYRWR